MIAAQGVRDVEDCSVKLERKRGGTRVESRALTAWAKGFATNEAPAALDDGNTVEARARAAREWDDSINAKALALRADREQATRARTSSERQPGEPRRVGT